MSGKNATIDRSSTISSQHSPLTATRPAPSCQQGGGLGHSSTVWGWAGGGLNRSVVSLDLDL